MYFPNSTPSLLAALIYHRRYEQSNGIKRILRFLIDCISILKCKSNVEIKLDWKFKNEIMLLSRQRLLIPIYNLDGINADGKRVIWRQIGSVLANSK